MPRDAWYVRLGDEHFGPVRKGELEEFARRELAVGHINVSTDGVLWRPLSDLLPNAGTGTFGRISPKHPLPAPPATDSSIGWTTIVLLGVASAVVTAVMLCWFVVREYQVDVFDMTNRGSGTQDTYE